MDKVYGIFSGAYSDWNVHGFLEDKEKARKYCAVQNERLGEDSYDSYYIVEIEKMDVEIKDVKLKYYYDVTFRFDSSPTKYTMDEASYDYYIGENKKPYTKYNNHVWGWISFHFNAETKEKAEKIAQDKYAQLLYYYSENNDFDESAKLMGATHI